MKQLLIQLLNRYKNYLSVIGATMIFGSWIVSSLLSDTVKDYESNLAFIINNDQTQNATEDFNREISNLNKLLLRTRSLDLPPDVEKLSLGHQRFYNWSKEYETIKSFFDDWTRLIEKADRTNTKLKIINVPFSLSHEFKETYAQINNLYSQYYNSTHSVDSLINLATGSGIAIKDIPDNECDHLADKIEACRNSIRNSPIESDYIILVNKLYKINFEVKESIENRLAVYKTLSSIFNWLSILFYVSGTLLTIYAKYIEVISKKTSDEGE